MRGVVEELSESEGARAFRAASAIPYLLRDGAQARCR